MNEHDEEPPHYRIQCQPRQGRETPLIGCDKWAVVEGASYLNRLQVLCKLRKFGLIEPRPPRDGYPAVDVLHNDEYFFRVVPADRFHKLHEAAVPVCDLTC